MKDMSTKERILYAALNLIAEKGYDGVGVDLIAEHAGLKGPSLYRHFKGKEDIFNSLIDLVMTHYEEGFGLKSCPENIPESMDVLIENAMEQISFTMHDDVVQKTRRILAMEQFRSKRMAELTSRYHLENLQQMYAGIFLELMKKGVLKQDDPDLLALEFVSPVSLFIHMYDRQPEREEEVLLQIRRHFEHFAKVYAETR
ncbi:MAG: TetR/AcrR family transcriptional regulator [Lachnospiraceae bacterium]